MQKLLNNLAVFWHMTFEIEKRSLFTSKEEFDRCKENVAKQGKHLDTFVYKSFLFRKPEYLRIRIVKGEPEATITKKIGTYQDPARKEINKQINLSELKSFLEEIKSKGFEECVCVETESNAYEVDGSRIEFTIMTYLGMIVEVEALTENETEIPLLRNKIDEIMKKFKLKELDADAYQKMMDLMYEKGLKPISEQEFSI